MARKQGVRSSTTGRFVTSRARKSKAVGIARRAARRNASALRMLADK